MQRMLQQIALEYTSKSNSSQDSPQAPQPNGIKDQSLAKASLLAATSPSTVCARNIVLGKLLMASQDFPLDLSVKKTEEHSTDHGRVDQLSQDVFNGGYLKKN
uniref:Uncharacterized protein n=1 Tax=Scleropages formosus TaxID=113540 RepID=A0A8C9T225_SCLFO